VPVLDTIGSAIRSIKLMAYFFTPSSVARALLAWVRYQP
jgi:hypothetical protein